MHPPTPHIHQQHLCKHPRISELLRIDRFEVVQTSNHNHVYIPPFGLSHGVCTATREDAEADDSFTNKPPSACATVLALNQGTGQRSGNAAAYSTATYRLSLPATYCTQKLLSRVTTDYWSETAANPPYSLNGNTGSCASPHISYMLKSACSMHFSAVSF